MDQFPVDCLRQVLKHLTLGQLLSVRGVSTSWRLVVESLFRTRRSLLLAQTQRDLVEYYSARYYFLENSPQPREGTTFTEGDETLLTGRQGAILPRLATLFPNLTSLTLIYDPTLVRLAEGDSVPGDLISLTLFAKVRSGEVSPRLWSWIDALPSLRSLSLYGLYDTSLPARFPALSRLSSLSLTGYSSDPCPVLAQLGVSLRHLALDRLSLPSVASLRALFARYATGLPAHLTHLSIGSLNTGMVTAKEYLERCTDYLSFFCGTFPHLAYLRVRFALQLPLEDLVDALARLPSLTELHLAQIGSSNGVLTRGRRDLSSMARLDSVRILVLEATTGKTAALEPLWRATLGRLFPAVESFTIRAESVHSADLLSSRVNYLRIQ